MKINGNVVKPGMIIEHKGELWVVNKSQSVKPGKGGAFNQVEMKNIKSGTKLNERFRSSDTIEKATITEDDYTFIYKDNNEFYFMNQKTFNQINLNKSIIGQKESFLSENLEVKINFYEDLPISIILPNQICCKIKQTEMVIKGQTVSSSYKPAILDNDLKVQVPPFINTGDEIIIDTKNIEYIKKKI